MTVALHSSSNWEVVLSLGMCSVGLVSIPLGYWNLEDNVKVRNFRVLSLMRAAEPFAGPPQPAA